jgi:hypothetical protein
MRYFWMFFYGGAEIWLVFTAGQMASKGYMDAAVLALGIGVWAQYKFHKV